MCALPFVARACVMALTRVTKCVSLFCFFTIRTFEFKIFPLLLRAPHPHDLKLKRFWLSVKSVHLILILCPLPLVFVPNSKLIECRLLITSKKPGSYSSTCNSVFNSNCFQINYLYFSMPRGAFGVRAYKKKRFRFGGGVIFKSTNQIEYHGNAIFTHRATPLTKEVSHSYIPFWLKWFSAVKSL